MGLVTAKEVAKAIKVDKFGFLGTSMGWLLMKVLKISTMNRIYDKHKHLKDIEFMNGLLDEFEIQFIELRFFENHSFKEMGYLLGMTEVNAKIKTYRILKKLKKLSENINYSE